MIVKVRCMSCGKMQETHNPKHIRDDQKRMSTGIMDTMLIPGRECNLCRPMKDNHVSNLVSIRFPSLRSVAS